MKQTLYQDISNLIEAALKAAQENEALPQFDIPAIPVERSRQAEHGDYGSAVCLKLAREARMNPLEIARRTIEHMPETAFVERAEAMAPGYINLWLDKDWLVSQVDDILQSGQNYGQLETVDSKYIQVEFVSANPTGPLTVGSARNGVLGDALAAVLQAAGHRVEREYYINDAGTQVKRFGESLLARYAGSLGHDFPFPEDGYKGEYVTEMGAQLAAEAGSKYLEMDQTEAIEALAEWGIDQVMSGIRQDLADLGINFDTWRSQRSLYAEGLLDQTLGLLREKGHVLEYDDAIWFRHPDLEKDAVLIRSPQVIPDPDDRPTYLAADVAYVWDKLSNRGFDRAIYIWGADHHGDVPRVTAAANALGLEPERIELILYQLITLWRGEEEIRMSTRAGEFVTLRELLDEVGPDPIRFMLLARSADSTIDFDIELAKEQSDRNPVFYVQYAHARLASILRNAQEVGWELDAQTDLALLHHESELELIRKMLELPEVISKAAERLTPHLMPFYAQELAAALHTFYRDCRVLSSDQDPGLTQARLRLVWAAKLVLARILQLMGMSTPERM